MFSSISLQSAAALLVYACQPVGRASGLNHSSFAPFHFHGAGGGVFRQISTIDGGAFSMLCMPAGREGELGERFFRFRCSIFPEQGRGGSADFGGSLPSADTCQQDWRGCTLNRVFFLFRR